MGANQGIHFEHFPDKSRPIAPESLGGDWGFQHGFSRPQYTLNPECLQPSIMRMSIYLRN